MSYLCSPCLMCVWCLLYFAVPCHLLCLGLGRGYYASLMVWPSVFDLSWELFWKLFSACLRIICLCRIEMQLTSRTFTIFQCVDTDIFGHMTWTWTQTYLDQCWIWIIFIVMANSHPASPNKGHLDLTLQCQTNRFTNIVYVVVGLVSCQMSSRMRMPCVAQVQWLWLQLCSRPVSMWWGQGRLAFGLATWVWVSFVSRLSCL